MQDMTNNPLIALEHAGVYRAGRWLVRDVNLTVSPGEIVTLIGPNGSGKSTTARAAIGLLKLNEGTARRARGITIGYVPQKLELGHTLPLSVARFMTLTGRHGPTAIADALSAVGMQGLEHRQARELSGGQFQRILLARAIIAKPQLLILDEPVQGVDFAGEIALYDLIAQIRKDTGCGILLISHDLHVVMSGTDTVVCLNGHVCCTGTPQSVAASPEYAQLFGPHAVETLALYHHQHDHTHLADGRVRHADGSITSHCHGADGHHHATPGRPADNATRPAASSGGDPHAG